MHTWCVQLHLLEKYPFFKITLSVTSMMRILCLLVLKSNWWKPVVFKNSVIVSIWLRKRPWSCPFVRVKLKKTVIFDEQKMSNDLGTSKFSSQMEASVFIIHQMYFCKMHHKMLIDNSPLNTYTDFSEGLNEQTSSFYLLPQLN